jgi:hypothetical protein
VWTIFFHILAFSLKVFFFRIWRPFPKRPNASRSSCPILSGLPDPTTHHYAFSFLDLSMCQAALFIPLHVLCLRHAGAYLRLRYFIRAIHNTRVGRQLAGPCFRRWGSERAPFPFQEEDRVPAPRCYLGKRKMGECPATTEIIDWEQLGISDQE